MTHLPDDFATFMLRHSDTIDGFPILSPRRIEYIQSFLPFDGMTNAVEPSGVSWKDKTPEEILHDINALLVTMHT